MSHRCHRDTERGLPHLCGEGGLLSGASLTSPLSPHPSPPRHGEETLISSPPRRRRRDRGQRGERGSQGEGGGVYNPPPGQGGNGRESVRGGALDSLAPAGRGHGKPLPPTRARPAGQGRRARRPGGEAVMAGRDRQ